MRLAWAARPCSAGCDCALVAAAALPRTIPPPPPCCLANTLPLTTLYPICTGTARSTHRRNLSMPRATLTCLPSAAFSPVTYRLLLRVYLRAVRGRRGRVVNAFWHSASTCSSTTTIPANRSACRLTCMIHSSPPRSADHLPPTCHRLPATAQPSHSPTAFPADVRRHTLTLFTTYTFLFRFAAFIHRLNLDVSACCVR